MIAPVTSCQALVKSGHRHLLRQLSTKVVTCLIHSVAATRVYKELRASGMPPN